MCKSFFTFSSNSVTINIENYNLTEVQLTELALVILNKMKRQQAQIETKVDLTMKIHLPDEVKQQDVSKKSTIQTLEKSIADSSVFQESYDSRAKSLDEINPKVFVTHYCEKCGNVKVFRNENVIDSCICGEKISKSKRIYYPLKYKCTKCGNTGGGYASAGLVERNCSQCGSVMDAHLQKGKIYCGEYY